MHLGDVNRIVQTALECSVYHAPLEPGLSYEEIIETGKRFGLRTGELDDSIANLSLSYIGKRYILGRGDFSRWLVPGFDEPSYRNLDALDFVFGQINECVREMGAARAVIDRSVLVERAVAQGLLRKDVDIAIATSVLAEQIEEREGLLRYPGGRREQGLPGQMARAHRSQGRNSFSDTRAKVYRTVGDVMARRSDGRAAAAEPLDAFSEHLDRLGYGNFRLWWTQIVREMRSADPNTNPTSITVLAAALVEGALTFVVKHARSQSLGTLASKVFEESPRSWRIDDLIKSAAAGRDDAILDENLRRAAERLVQTRQRIHAGRMLSDHPSGVPDLRPEEARDARAAAEQVVRRVVDWLDEHPPR